MDEIDAIGGRRFSEGTSADREIQRTLMELLNQLDGFDQLGKVNLVYNLIPLCELILNKKISLGKMGVVFLFVIISNVVGLLGIFYTVHCLLNPAWFGKLLLLAFCFGGSE
jgi:hypothetical protein